MVTAANPYRDQRTQYDPGMGMDELCDALNLGKYIGVLAPSGGEPTISSAIISFLQSGSATSRTTQNKLREVEVSITDYGAVDSADIKAAFDLAKAAYPNGCTIVFPETTNHWLLSSQISTPDATPYILKGRGITSLIKKGFSGDMIDLGKQSQMVGVHIDGEGGTYTGRGVIVTTGANDNTSWRKFLNCEILDMESHCIEWTADTAGFKSQVEGGRYVVTNDAVSAFKVPNDTTVGNRTFIGVDTADTPIIDLQASQNTALIVCQGGVPDFSGQPLKTRIVGCRIHGASSIEFDGTDLTVTGNVFGQSTVTYAAGLSRCRIMDNAFPTHTVTDNAGGASSSNYIEYGPISYTPAWTATGTAPALGNGTLSGSYSRSGYRIKANLLWIAGSTTTFGTGAWSFSLPKAAARSEVCSAYAADTGTGFYSGISRVVASASTVQTYFGDNNGNSTTNTIPFTWANTDRMELNLDYAISG